MSNSPITKKMFLAALPESMGKVVSDKLIDSINNTLQNPDTLEVFRENLLSFGSVMQQGKFKIEHYINAVKYVSFKLLRATNKQAYINTFPDKHNRWVMEGLSEKDMAAYVSRYNNTKLVNLIYAQTLVPMHVLNAPMYQDALNTQARLMYTAKSEKVQSDAANSILTHLKPPEENKIELNIGVGKGEETKRYLNTLEQMAEAQQSLLAAGGDITKVTNLKIQMNDDDDVIDVVPGNDEDNSDERD